MLPALRCLKTVKLWKTNERERHRPKFTLGDGAVLNVPHEICLATRDQEKINHTDRTQTDLRH